MKVKGSQEKEEDRVTLKSTSPVTKASKEERKEGKRKEWMGQLVPRVVSQQIPARRQTVLTNTRQKHTQT